MLFAWQGLHINTAVVWHHMLPAHHARRFLLLLSNPPVSPQKRLHCRLVDNIGAGRAFEVSFDAVGADDHSNHADCWREWSACGVSDQNADFHATDFVVLDGPLLVLGG